MTEQERQRLSALVDAELPRPEIAGELGKLLRDPRAQVAWQHHHLIGDAMRQELGPLVDPGLAAKVSARRLNGFRAARDRTKWVPLNTDRDRRRGGSDSGCGKAT